MKKERQAPKSIFYFYVGFEIHICWNVLCIQNIYIKDLLNVYEAAFCKYEAYVV